MTRNVSTNWVPQLCAKSDFVDWYAKYAKRPSTHPRYWLFYQVIMTSHSHSDHKPCTRKHWIIVLLVLFISIVNHRLYLLYCSTFHRFTDASTYSWVPKKEATIFATVPTNNQQQARPGDSNTSTSSVASTNSQQPTRLVSAIVNQQPQISFITSFVYFFI